MITASENLLLLLSRSFQRSGTEPKFLHCTCTQHINRKIVLILSKTVRSSTGCINITMSCFLFRKEKKSWEDTFLNTHYRTEDLRKIILIASTSIMLICPTAFVPANFNMLPDAFLATVSACSHVYMGRMLAKEVKYFFEQNSWILMINKVPRKQHGLDTLYEW